MDFDFWQRGRATGDGRWRLPSVCRSLDEVSDDDDDDDDSVERALDG